ncbi:MAG: DUF4412 domain-containing protein [Verrucomicrobiia bacterium]
MKIYLRSFVFGLLCLNLAVHAQMGPGHGPHFDSALEKLFGHNQSFSSTLEMQMKAGDDGNTMVMPGKIYFDAGKSRFEMNMSEMKGHQMPPEAAAHMKAMGMDKMVTITLPKDKTAYLIYPDMQAYVVTQVSDTEAATNDFKMETTELGKETVDGHPCVKSQVVVTDPEGNQHESTVWNATDLNKFPIKIEQSEEGHEVTMLFKDIKLSKPDASLFNPPAGYTKYDSMPAMMQAEMMKHMGGGMMPGGMPGGAGQPPEN